MFVRIGITLLLLKYFKATSTEILLLVVLNIIDVFVSVFKSETERVNSLILHRIFTNTSK